MLKNKCCSYVIISIRFFSITICNLLIEFPSYMWARPTRCTPYFLYLFQLYCPLHVSNEQVHHQEVTSVHAAYSVFHACMWCIVANRLWLGSNRNMLATRQWKMLYAACTEVTSWWWTFYSKHVEDIIIETRKGNKVCVFVVVVVVVVVYCNWVVTRWQ